VVLWTALCEIFPIDSIWDWEKSVEFWTARPRESSLGA